jgi:hypothetical protein
MTKLITHNRKQKIEAAKSILLQLQLWDEDRDNLCRKRRTDAYISLTLCHATELDDEGKLMKYRGQPYWTSAALQRLLENQAFNQEKKPYHKKISPYFGLIHEHAVPRNLIRELIYQAPRSEEAIFKILDELSHAVIVTREEDRFLNRAGLKSHMPPGIDFPTPATVFARYHAIGVTPIDTTQEEEDFSDISFNDLYRLKK